ncbi:agmatine coumaroyltransferase-2-like [Panicum virgatum]|uniref:Agmatine coumaroyltransferase-2 n=1 Tax=Panicum virgatum TaxID=38727 RepID=A0A8T0PAS8_PANVG|nr:agmatine coumaroyltransferase-2-like [Panicum virgatum]KAG2558720.1 hypothetical protein PVAP13_8NG345500 [Panicum virgatum]
MKITVQSSKAIRPARGGAGGGAPSTAADAAIPLTVFDKANYDLYISGINFFRPPAPPNAALAAGLARALAEYREWAGRLGADAADRRAILLTDAGARLVEATADVALGAVMPMEPAPEVLGLHPDGDGAEELLLVQLTRFACGSLAVGHTMHHPVADGRAACNFLLAWGQATRGAAFDPAPAHGRASLFVPRDPPRVAFEHRGVEFKPPPARGESPGGRRDVAGCGGDEVVVRRVRFGQEFVAELRSRASAGAPRPYSTLQCVAAHLWRCITAARGLEAREVTRLCVAVDGRARMRCPRVPDGYAGNVVLWARPAATAGELVSRPLRFAVELLSREVARVDDGYFRSFIDFASSGAVEEERLVPAADAAETVYSPDVEVDSLLHAPFYDLDFGGGPPFFFMPGYLPVEGSVFVVRSFSGDRSVDAYVPLFSRAMDTFTKCCYSLEMADARL